MSTPLHTVIESLKIIDQSGNVKEDNIKGKVQLVGSRAIDLINDGNNGIEIKFNPTKVNVNQYYKDKYQALKDGGSGDDYTFTGAPYYISTINSSGSDNGNIFLLGQECSQMGMFADYEHPDAEGTLQFFDMCLPDIDCEDYEVIYEYLNILSNYYDDLKNKIINPPVEEDRKLKNFGMLDQYKALIAQWNYLASVSSIKATAWGEPRRVFIKTSYINLSPDNITNTTCTITCTVSGATFSFSAITHKFYPDTQHSPSVAANDSLGIYRISDYLEPNQKWGITIAYTSEDVIRAGTTGIITITWSNTHLPDRTLTLNVNLAVSELESSSSSS